MMSIIKNKIRVWRQSRDGVALTEAAILFPTLFLMLFGVYDVGHAITTNHKMITAANVVADLITRGRSVSENDITQAIQAGRLAMAPYVSGAETFKVYIASVQFDEDDEPVVLWEEMSGIASADTASVEKSIGLGTEGEGVVVVSIEYDYEPTFGNMVLNEFRMKEVAFARGRRSAIVTKE